jgi:phosphoserine phosphatase
MIVVFDFDKTLTYKDTLFDYYRLCSKNEITGILKILIYVLLMVIHKFKIISNQNLKRMGVNLFLRGKSKEFISKCAEEYSGKIKLNKIHAAEFKRYISPYIVSASFSEYLKPLFPEARIISSEIEYNNHRVVSLKSNRYGEEKCLALKDLGINCIDILYTDSISDLPLAQIAKEINLVKGDRIVKCDDLEHFVKMAV